MADAAMRAPVSFGTLSTLSTTIDDLMRNVARTMRLDPFRSCFTAIGEKNAKWNDAVSTPDVTWHCLFLPAPTFQTNRPNSINFLAKEFGYLTVAVDALRWVFVKTDSQKKWFFLEEMPNTGIRLHFFVAVDRRRALDQIGEAGGEVDGALANEFKVAVDAEAKIADAARLEALQRARAQKEKKERDGAVGVRFASPDLVILDAVNRPAGRDIRPGPVFPRGLTTAIKDMSIWRDMAIAVGTFDPRKFGRRYDRGLSAMDEIAADAELRTACPFYRALCDEIAEMSGELAEQTRGNSDHIVHCVSASSITLSTSLVCPKRVFDPNIAFLQSQLTFLLYMKESVVRAKGDPSVIAALQRERDDAAFLDPSHYGPTNSHRAPGDGLDMVVNVGNPYFCVLSLEDVRDIFDRSLPRHVLDQIQVLVEVFMHADDIQAVALERKRANEAGLAAAAAARPLPVDADPNDVEAAVDEMIGNMAGAARSARSRLDIQPLAALGRNNLRDWTCLIGFRDDLEANPPRVWHYRRTLLIQRLADMYTAHSLNGITGSNTVCDYDKYTSTRAICRRANLEIDQLASLPHVSSEQRATLLTCKVLTTQAALSAPFMQTQISMALIDFLDELDARGEHIHVPLRHMHANTDSFGNILVTMQSALSEVFVVTTNFNPIFHCLLAALAGNMPDDIVNNRMAPHVLVSAPPGVGKTYLLFLLKDVLLMPKSCELVNHASALASVAAGGIKKLGLTVVEPELNYENLHGDQKDQSHVGSSRGAKVAMEFLMGNPVSHSIASMRDGRLVVDNSTSQATGTNLFAGNIEKKCLSQPAQRRLTDVAMVNSSNATLSKLVALLVPPTSLRSQAKVAYVSLFSRIHAVHIRICEMMHYGMIPTPSTDISMPIIWRVMEDLNSPDSPVQVEITSMQRMMMRIMASCIWRVAAYLVTGEKSPLAHSNLAEDNTEGRINLRGAVLVAACPLLVVTTADIIRGLHASMCEFSNPVRTAVMNELLASHKKFPQTAAELAALLRDAPDPRSSVVASVQACFSQRRIVGYPRDDQLQTFGPPQRRRPHNPGTEEEEGDASGDSKEHGWDGDNECDDGAGGGGDEDDDMLRPDGRLTHSEAKQRIAECDPTEYAFMQVSLPRVDLVNLEPTPEAKTGIAGAPDRRRKRKITATHDAEPDAQGFVQSRLPGIQSMAYAVGRFPDAFRRIEHDTPQIAKALAHLAFTIARSLSGTRPDEIVAHLIPLATTRVALGPLPWASDAYNNSQARNGIKQANALMVTDNFIHIHLPTIFTAKSNSVMSALLKRLSHRHATPRDIVIADAVGERNSDFKVLRIRPQAGTELNLRVCKPADAGRGNIASEQLLRLMTATDAADFIAQESKHADTVIKIRTDTDHLAIHESFARFIPPPIRASYSDPQDRINFVQTLFHDVARRNGLKTINVMECFDDMLGEPAGQPSDKPVYDPKDVEANRGRRSADEDKKEEKKRAPVPAPVPVPRFRSHRHSSSSSSSSSSVSPPPFASSSRSHSHSSREDSKSPVLLSRTFSTDTQYDGVPMDSEDEMLQQLNDLMNDENVQQPPKRPRLTAPLESPESDHPVFSWRPILNSTASAADDADVNFGF